jgi:hypothetical protein
MKNSRVSFCHNSAYLFHRLYGYTGLDAPFVVYAVVGPFHCSFSAKMALFSPIRPAGLYEAAISAF